MSWPVLVAALLGLGQATQDCTKSECPLDDSSLRFMVIGDFGGVATYPYYTSIQHQNALMMGQWGTQMKTQFQLGVGDNFYSKGVKKVTDPRFKSTFEDVYTSPSLFTPWYMLAGNHDYNGNITAQLEYTKVSGRWKFPALQYVVKYKMTGGTRLTFILIDTIQLCSQAKPRRKSSPVDGAQWQWVEEQLQTNSANSNYLFVVGHYPIYSIAEHGPTACLVEKLEPLMSRYRVSAYLSGHDHNLQHLSHNVSGWPLNYIVSGAGALLDGSTAHKGSVPAGLSRFYFPQGLTTAELGVKRLGGGKDGGFVYGEMNAFLGRFTFVQSDGTTLYQFQIRPRL